MNNKMSNEFLSSLIYFGSSFDDNLSFISQLCSRSTDSSSEHVRGFLLKSLLLKLFLFPRNFALLLEMWKFEFRSFLKEVHLMKVENWTFFSWDLWSVLFRGFFYYIDIISNQMDAHICITHSQYTATHSTAQHSIVIHAIQWIEMESNWIVSNFYVTRM